MKKQKKNKIVFIIFGFSKKNFRKQPWFTVNKLCQKYLRENYEVNLITDAKKFNYGKINIIRVKKFFNLFSSTKEIKKEIKKINPSKTYILVGSLGLIFPLRYKIYNNLTFLIGNNRFHFNEILRLSFKDFFSEFKLLFLPTISSLIPSFIFNLSFYLIGKCKIVYFSKAAQQRYHQIGLPKGKIFKPLKNKIIKKKNINFSKLNKIFLTYFGPPLNVRGLDIVLNVFEKLSQKKEGIYLNLLIRNNNELYLKKKMIKLKKKIEYSLFKKNIILDTTYYSKKKLFKKIKASTINILPFKITLSDNPLVLYEAVETKVPLFILDTPGVTENAKNTNSYISKNQNDLYNKLANFIGLDKY